MRHTGWGTTTISRIRTHTVKRSILRGNWKLEVYWSVVLSGLVCFFTLINSIFACIKRSLINQDPIGTTFPAMLDWLGFCARWRTQTPFSDYFYNTSIIQVSCFRGRPYHLLHASTKATPSTILVVLCSKLLMIWAFNKDVHEEIDAKPWFAKFNLQLTVFVNIFVAFFFLLERAQTLFYTPVYAIPKLLNSFILVLVFVTTLLEE